ncbi:AsmA family protein [Flavobacterium caeni]|uniref:AsmA protein n=1 Tax=Flavobacterium caeni TaxID=490189 RepID=A0A1G5GJS7_9FLAO|nr:AsmA-like C-terminal region-containing protein [Flavobacterium caeni]SCY50968.1 AsmA protein [Flavobacterium caeni]
MKPSVRSRILKVLKWTGISIAGLLLVLFLLPVLFPGQIEQKIKDFANERLEGELHFKEADLSFFAHFPSLTLTLKDFKLNGSKPYAKQTLVSADEISFGINLKRLVFNGQVHIDKIFLSKALMNVQVNEKGEANYNVYVSEETTETDDPSGTSLKLERIDIRDSHLVYNDRSAKMLIDARGFDYLGKGALDQAVFDIFTEAEIGSLDLSFDGETYLKNKRVRAELVTQINTNSLAFVFAQNNLKINKLPVEFTGKFDFLRNGYDIDFKIQSQNSKLNDFFTALPPQYVTWLEKTSVDGRTDLSLTLKGQYIASQNKKPDVAFNMKIRDGEIESNKAPLPVTNLYLNFDTKLPALDPERLQVNIDSIFFNVGKDYFKAIVKSEGMSKPVIDARVQSELDLQKMDQAFGIDNIDLKGKLDMNIVSKGTYDKTKDLFPVTNGKFSLQNASVQTTYYPQPIQNINLVASLTNRNGAFQDSKLVISPASFVFEGKPFALRATFDDFADVAYDIQAKGEIDVAKVYRVFSQKGLDLQGFIKADVAFKGKQSDATEGRYDKLDNRGTLALRDIRMRSGYFPKPFVIRDGLFAFDRNRMTFDNFNATYGQSDFKLNGALENVINYALSDRETLKGSFALASQYLNIDEFTSGVAETPTDSTATTPTEPAKGVIAIPRNLDLQFSADAAKVHFDGLELTQTKGNLSVHQGKLSLRNTGFELIGTKVAFEADYTNETPSRAAFDFKVSAKDFDIKRAYDEVKLFREMASAAENAQGIISLAYKVNGKLDDQMQPIYPSLEGGGTISVRKVKVMGFKMFGAVSRETQHSELENPDVADVQIHSSIKNNIITVERFKFKMAGFRPRIEGTTSFDGAINFKMRLGLPPLGIIGIPMTITGTKDDPKVKLGRQTEELAETKYVETATPVAKDSTAAPVQTKI